MKATLTAYPRKKKVNQVNTWQVCPKCNGQGLVSKPSWIAGDVVTWVSSEAIHTCDVCNRKKIISRETGNPPEQSKWDKVNSKLDEVLNNLTDDEWEAWREGS